MVSWKFIFIKLSIDKCHMCFAFFCKSQFNSCKIFLLKKSDSTFPSSSIFFSKAYKYISQRKFPKKYIKNWQILEKQQKTDQ